MFGPRCRGLLGVLLLAIAGQVAAQEDPSPWQKGKVRLTTGSTARPALIPRRPFLGKFGEGYISYAHVDYTNYETFLGPRPWRYIYDAFGNFLIGGEDLYSWTQQTTTDRLVTSTGRGPVTSARYANVFDRAVAIGGQDYQGRAARMIIADGGPFYDDGIITRYSPLVLNQLGLQGVRTDLSAPQGRLSLIAARRYAGYRATRSEIANDSGILLGGRLERDLGVLRFGANFANQHLFDFRKNLGGVKGDLHSSQAIPAVIAVRVSDDSPEDGRGGPVVVATKVYVNGQLRPDIIPGIVSQNFGNDFTAVGRTTTQGEFRRDPYYDADIKRISDEYRGMEIPLYADYFYFKDYLKDPASSGVAQNVNLNLLTQSLRPVSPNQPQRADGEEYLMYYVELEGEPYVRSIRVDFLIGNDYRVDLSSIDVVASEEARYQRKYNAPFFETVARAPGNTQDLSNLRWVSVDVGAGTGQTLYSGDLHGNLGGLELRAEFARSRTHYRYPDGTPGSQVQNRGGGPVLQDWHGVRHAVEDQAYYLTLHREGDIYGFGAELFSTGPAYNTQLRLRPGDMDISYNPRYLYQQIKNSTTFLELIEDNDDNDARLETVLRGTLREPDRSVFPAQDVNNDGIPDINRNLNSLPDFAEPFLMYDVDPNEYDWGLDLNNNGEIDLREDDREPDLPYDKDLGGFHLFGRRRLSPHSLATLGILDADQWAGAGGSAVRYARLSYRREQPRLGSVRMEYELKQVEDDVADDVFRWASVVGVGIEGISQEAYRIQRFAFTPDFVQDPLAYRKSLVNRAYLEARFTRVSGLRVENKLKLESNRQSAISALEGVPQPADRMGFLTLVSRADYTWQRGRFTVVPQAKFRLLRRTRDRLDQVEADERSFIPILKVTCALTNRTALKAGAQGLPFLPYRVTDRADRRNSFRQRTYLLVLSNRSPYAGYDLSTNIGLNMEKRDFSDPFRSLENTNFTSVFVKVFLGFGGSSIY